MGGEVSAVPADSADRTAHRAWIAEKVEEFIHLLELQAVIHTLHAFQSHLQARVVHLLCDNTVVIAAIRKGFALSAKMRAVLGTLQLLLPQGPGSHHIDLIMGS